MENLIHMDITKHRKFKVVVLFAKTSKLGNLNDARFIYISFPQIEQ